MRQHEIAALHNMRGVNIGSRARGAKQWRFPRRSRSNSRHLTCSVEGMSTEASRVTRCQGFGRGRTVLSRAARSRAALSCIA